MAKSDVSKTLPVLSFTDDELTAIRSYDDAVALTAQALGGQVAEAENLIGDGFSKLDNKDRLLGVPFILVNWGFNEEGEFGEFMYARLVTKDGQKYRISDGSTGLATELKTLTERTGLTGGLQVKNGLRKSEYPRCNDCQTNFAKRPEKCPNPKNLPGKHAIVTAQTFYLNV